MIKVLEKSPLQLFSRQLVRLKSIQNIQLDLKNSYVRKLGYKLHYLNQTYIFHLVAYWQDFIETLIKKAFVEMEEKVQSKSIKKELYLFNTPSTDNIDKMFKNTLNITKITDCWNHSDLNRESAKIRLKNILNSRHQIAHEGRSKDELTYSLNYDNMKFIFKLATLLQSKVDEIIQANKY